MGRIYEKKYGVIFAVFGFIIFFFYMEGWGVDWKLCGHLPDGDCYYDAESITHPSKETIRVWSKVLFNEKGVIDWREYKTLSFAIALNELHCVDKKYRDLSLILYSGDGKVLYKTPVDVPSDWDFIPPGSAIETLYKTLCK